MSSNLSKKTNNPLNIRYSPVNNWIGTDSKVPQINGFVHFISEKYGVRAAMLLLVKYLNRGCKSIRKIIERWAPPSENDSDAYIIFVEHAYIKEFGDLEWHGEKSLILLVRLMARYESSTELSDEYLYRIYKMICNEKRIFEKLVNFS